MRVSTHQKDLDHSWKLKRMQRSLTHIDDVDDDDELSVFLAIVDQSHPSDHKLVEIGKINF